MREQIIKGLITHLQANGMTFSTENGDPAVTRPMKAEVLVTEIIDYLIGAGYANDNKA